MKQPLKRLSQQYMAALRTHLQQGSQASLRPALKLGGRALLLGLEKLDLARMHVQAMVTLKLARRTNSLTRRAGVFLTEALVPIVGTQRSSRRGRIDPDRPCEAPERSGLKMAAMNLQLKRSVVRHKGAEAGLRKRGEECARLLKGALPKQEGLRKLTYRILLAQEDERRNLSRKLQDDIAQTLLSINVHLLNLRTAARGGKTSLVKEVASAQRLVEDSIKFINRFACELDARRPA